MQEISLRVVTIGDSKVGKTSLIYRYIKDQYDENLSPTVGVSVYPRVLPLEKYNVVVNICDTAGQEKYRSLGSIFYHNAIGAIVVFDVTNRESFENVPKWVEEYKANAQEPLVFIAANKSDISDKAVITFDETLELANQLETQCIWTSAKDGSGVTDLFELLNDEIKEYVLRSNAIIENPTTKPASSSSSCC
ncbi:Ras-related protein RABA4b [Tritrichomonas foetus]|uniref:Ras-related protein RABA4b n=1 Tax=Tritrichomonas foetus TaxID=1144522 RepID=A0A1J4K097_9EUKA|nr:Ras-related protein RABA4b [Tritrichomonas foetus]|eukprot:OHT04839.1 Ras-related protein RABA4b [Tritrichomonas foetus]